MRKRRDKNTLQGVTISRVTTGNNWVISAYLLVLGALMIVLPGCNVQRSMLYFPGEDAVEDVTLYCAHNNLQMWPEKGRGYRGIISKKRSGNFRGTVVIFHGNAGPAVFREYYFDPLEERGYRVVLAEYPGYGGRPGDLSEKSLVADARLTALRAKEEFGGPLYLWGESLGCGVASALAADPTLKPAGIVMLTPWDSLLNEAKARFFWLPTKLITSLLHDRYDNIANLGCYKGPVAVIMSRHDEVIPNRLTKRLYEALSGPKRLWIFEHSGHNDWSITSGKEWWGEVMDFMKSSRANPIP